MSLREAFVGTGIALKDRPPSVGFGEITKMFEETLTPANLSMLGYTREQREFAQPVLALLGQQGEIRTHTGNPYLSFVDPEKPRVISAEIYPLPENRGFLFLADRDEYCHDWQGLTPDERLRRVTFWRNPMTIFADRPERVARVGLVDRGTATDLKTLVRVLCSNEAVEQKRDKFKYKEAWWVDPKTKFEFIVELDEKMGIRRTRPRCIAYRRIEKQGEWVVFAQKANVTESWVRKKWERRETLFS